MTGVQTCALPIFHAGLAVSGVYELGPIRDTYLNDKLQLSDRELATLSPMRLPMVRPIGSASTPAFSAPCRTRTPC